MRTIHSLLPENSTAKAYISVLLNITHFVLESGQGKRCFLYDMFTASGIVLIPTKVVLCFSMSTILYFDFRKLEYLGKF